MLTFALIDSLYDAFKVRSIRNSCREFMTRDTRMIGFPRQLKWWNDYKQCEDKWCYLMFDDNKPVGYGLVRKLQNGYWLSGGLIPNVRGQGLGKKLFQFLVSEFAFEDKPISLEVRKENGIAYKLYQKLGFKETSQKDGIIVMQWQR